MTIFLSGFMGCGKSTVGRILAAKLGIGYNDSDGCIVEREGISIPEIFAQKGEQYFRQAEAEIIKDLCGKDIVVGCGGGAMLNDDTAHYASKHGLLIFLDVPFEVCYSRIKDDSNRPIVMSSTKDELRERYNKRYPVYNKNSTAQIKFASADTPVKCAEKIMEYINDNL